MATIVIQFMSDDGTNNGFKIAVDQETFDRMVGTYQIINAPVDPDPKSPTYGQPVPLTPEEAQHSMFEGTVAAWIDVTNRFAEDVAVEAARKVVTKTPVPPIEIGAAAAVKV